MTLSDNTQWWHSVITLSNNTQLRVENDCSIVPSSSICERMKWLVMRQKRRVPRCYQPLECTPVFSQVPAEIPTGHLLGSLSGYRSVNFYQGASGISAGIPARIKTSKQNWMKSGFAGSSTNPIFHFRLIFFSEKDQRSSWCWNSLTVPSCQTREAKIETRSVFMDWFENGR